MHAVDKEILLERRRLAGQVLATTASVVLAGLALGQGVLYIVWLARLTLKWNGSAASPAHPWAALLALALVGLLLAAWRTRQAWRESALRAGRLRDERLAASKNRLEASAELGQSTEALAQAQREETAAYLAGQPARRRSYLLGLTTACLVALLLLNGVLATRLGALCRGPVKLTPALAKKTEPPKPPPFARLDIVSPESETRATPIEEVVVAGKSDSDNGFTALSLHASLNGAPDTTLPLDPKLFAKGGPTKFDESMLLDQLKAQPYDVVSYYFQGISRHEKPLTVSSQMQFIEVRPFREDIHKTDLGGNGDSDCFAKLTWLISQQLIISKRSWVIASNQLPPTDPLIVSSTRETGTAQDKIAGSTNGLFKVMTAKGYPAAIVDHVSQAETAMHAAVDQIRKPALLAANPLQRQALGELVAATKAFVKVMSDKRAAGVNPNAVEGPFKDKQKLPPPTKVATNPMIKLKNLIKREQDIVKDLASSSTPLPTPANPHEPDTGNHDPLLAHSDLIPPPSKGGGPPPEHPDPPSNPPPPGGSSSGAPMAANPPAPKPGQDVPPAPPPAPPEPGTSPLATDKPKGGDGPALKPPPGPGSGSAPAPPPAPPEPGTSPLATDKPKGGDDPAPQPSPGPGSGSAPGGPKTAQDQAQIGKELGQMQDQPGSEAKSNNALAEAQAAAQASADALAAEDRPGALNAARNAEAAMLRAHEAMAAAAGEQMRDALAQAQQQLQDAARAQRDAATPTAQAQIVQQAQAVREALDRLRQEQAAMGDPKLASLADSLLSKYDASGIPPKLEGLGRGQGGSMEERAAAAEMMSKFAGVMASSRLAMQSESKNLEDTLARIDRVQHNMDQTRGTPEEQAQFAQELQADLATAVSDADALLPPGDGDAPGTAPGASPGTSPGDGSSGKVGKADTDNSSLHRTAHAYIDVPIHPVSPSAFQGLRVPLAAFRQEIEQRLEALRTQAELTYLNPDQSPEAYRAQVAAYYERISREAKAAAPEAAKPSGP